MSDMAMVLSPFSHMIGDLDYRCTLTKSKSANFLKAYCTLTEGKLHPRSNSLTIASPVIKLTNITPITFPERLSQTLSKGSIRCDLV